MRFIFYFQQLKTELFFHDIQAAIHFINTVTTTCQGDCIILQQALF